VACKRFCLCLVTASVYIIAVQLQIQKLVTLMTTESQIIHSLLQICSGHRNSLVTNISSVWD